jgi:hypothetical protein
VQVVQKNQRIKEKRCIQKKREKRTGAQVHLVLDSGACVIGRREQLKRQTNSTNVTRRNIWNMSIYFLEPIPENFGYSLGGYSHRERCRAPDRKKSTKEGEESKLVIKNKLMDRRIRHNWLHLVSKELWLHCRQNEHRLLPSGAIHES